jgi:hypothetical protein
MKPEFRFRLNGVIIPEIRIQRAMVNGEAVGGLQTVVRDDTIGWFALDDTSALWDRNLPRFNIEYRNETEWSRIDPLQRRIDKRKGWKTVTPQQLIDVLVVAGVIDLR